MAKRSTPRFTRRDFEFLADHITPHLHWPTGIEKIADELARTNPRFNRDKWVNRATNVWEEHAVEQLAEIHNAQVFAESSNDLDDEIPY